MEKVTRCVPNSTANQTFDIIDLWWIDIDVNMIYMMSLPYSLSSEIIDNLAQYAPHSVWDNGFLQFLTYMEKETNASFIPPADQFFDIIDLDCLWRQNIKEIDLCYEYNHFYRMRISFCVYLFSWIPKKYISRVFIFANGRLKNNSRVLIFANSHLLKRISV